VVPPRPGATISTALKYKGGEARVELLTPLRSGTEWEPTLIKSLAFGAQKAPFLDYLIEEPIEATYLAEDGIRVRVPHPARFALHKLIVAENRPAGSQTKSVKDKTQATELILALDELRTTDLESAAKRLVAYGPKYVEKAIRAARTLGSPVRDRVLSLIK
jgi:hypothetical protein